MNSIRMTSILGNHQYLDGGAMFGNVPRAMWERWEEVDSLSRILLQCRCFLVEIGSRKILLEAGIGCFFPEELSKRYGVNQREHKLVENLKELKLVPEDITDIILSHLHFDHAGGLLPSYDVIQKNGMSLVFNNARIFISKTAWERASNPHPRDKASFIQGMAELLEDSGKLLLIDDQEKDKVTHQELPGVFSFSFSHGHTPGHMHTWIQGLTENFVFAGDLIPGKSWVHLPITMGYDRYPELVIDEKKKFYERVLKLNTNVLYTHDARVACSKIVFDVDKKKYFPTNDCLVLNHVEF